MLNYSELRKGTVFVLDNEPYQVLEYEFLRMQQRKPVAKTIIRNLINGKVTDRTFHYGDEFAEAEIEKRPIKFIYENRGEYWFHEPNDPSKRFPLKAELIGNGVKFLKVNTEVTAVVFDSKIINIELPIKIDLLVKEAPPSIKGNTAQGGTKAITLETAAIIQAPLFIETGDIVRVNTQTGLYAERVEKTK